MIAVVDYGRGNLGSVEKAFGRVGIPARVTDDPRVLDDAEACVLPGDGAFRDAMQNLDALGFLAALRRALDGRRPFLGICLGYQLLFTESEEFGHTKGLDVVSGVVRRFPRGLKVPHMGWNEVFQARGHALWQGIADASRFYFVHSYYPAPRDPVLGAGECVYGLRFTCAVARDNLFAVQFHPEKSQSAGLQLLHNFVHWHP